jgi:hypothetical protein
MDHMKFMSAKISVFTTFLIVLLFLLGIGVSSFMSAQVYAYDDPGCTNEDCPPDPDPGCTNEDCPPDPDPGCTNEDCPPDYWAGCCCYEEYNQATDRTERICCCNEEQNVTCRWSYVTDPVAPLHATISDVFVTMDPVEYNAQGLCMPDWFTVYVGDAWESISLNCSWWGRLQTCPMTVIVDIKPGSDPNCFNLNGNGVIPVGVNGSDSFDVHEIDLSSLSFAGLAVRIKGNGNPQCGYQDWNGDGYIDLICQFIDDPVLWLPGYGEATLTGSLIDGIPFTGSDSICIQP